MKKTILILLMIFLLSAGADAAIFNDNSYGTSATGTTGDSAATNSTSSWSVISLLKGIYALWSTGVSGLAANTQVTPVTNGTPVALMTRTDGAVVSQIGATPEMVYNYANVSVPNSSNIYVMYASANRRIGLANTCFYNKDTVTHTLTLYNGFNDIAYITAAAGQASCLESPQGIWVSINTNVLAHIEAAYTTTAPIVSGQGFQIGAD